MLLVDLYPTAAIGTVGFAPPVDLLRSYLQVVRPLVVLCMGHEVFQNIEPSSSSHSLLNSRLGV